MGNAQPVKKEYCEKCGKPQGVKGYYFEREESAPGNDKVVIITINYHCEKCNTLIRAEEFEE